MSASAQHSYSLIHYDETVLPQTSIGNIQQDKYGYLWMNTQYGIVRFDGKEFKTFTTTDVKGLSSNRLRLCAADNSGNVYFVDENQTVLQVTSPNGFRVASAGDLYNEFRFPIYSSSLGNNDIMFLSFPTRDAYQRFSGSLHSNNQREKIKCYTTGDKKGYFFYADTTDKVKLCYYEGNRYSVLPVSDSFQSGNTGKLSNHVFWQTTASSAILFNETKDPPKRKHNGAAIFL